MVEGFNSEAPANADTQTPAEPQHVDPPQPEVHIPQGEPVQQSKPENWEARFHTLQGKYNAEVPRLRAQLQDVQNASQTLLQQIEEMKRRPAPAEPETLVTDHDREAFGADMVDLMERAAKQHSQKVLREVEQIRAENAQLREKVGQVDQNVAVSANDAYVAKLTQAVSDWEQINGDERFLAWLGEVDPVFGAPRQAGLDAAYAKLDAAATARVFNTFKATIAQAPAPRNPQQELQRQVAPTRSRVAAAPTADEGATRIWTGQEIEHFFTEARRGNISDADAGRIEAEINRAVAEGRVR